MYYSLQTKYLPTIFSTQSFVEAFLRRTSKWALDEWTSSVVPKTEDLYKLEVCIAQSDSMLPVSGPTEEVQIG